MLAGDLEVGHADVDVVPRGRSRKQVDQSSFVALRPGQSLSIKFVITDALEGAAVVGIEGGVVTLEEGAVALDFPEGVLDGDTPITVERWLPGMQYARCFPHF